MKALVCSCALWVALVVSGTAGAVDIKGVTVPEQASIPTVDRVLVLNGAGVRKKFFFSIYVGALYLEKKTDTAKAILNADRPRRVSMYFLYDKIEAEKLRDAWTEGFQDNVPAEEMPKLAARLEKFNAMFGDVVKGDVAILDYVPGVGTRVSIDQVVKGTIPGADFNRALLSVWLGDNPVTESLKQAMLGK